MPLEKRPDQGGRLFGLIEGEMMPSAGHVRPFHVWTDLLHVVQECWRQT